MSKLNPAAMLSIVAQQMARLPSLPTMITLSRTFHQTSILAQKKGKSDPREKLPCPENEVDYCRVLKRAPCSPTEPHRSGSDVSDDCGQSTYPCCVNKRFAERPCEKSGKISELKKYRTPFQSMWETYEGKKYARPETMWDYPKECCPQCEDPRFDVLYYTPSNKCRNYQRTWWECSPRMVPKRVCCWCDAVPPQANRRTITPPAVAAACVKIIKDKRIECINKNASDCLRLKMPCCRTSRIPPDCRRTAYPSDCEKIKCPFPSYSECLQEDPAVIPERPPECLCSQKQPICDQLRRAKHMSLHNISLYPCD